MRRLAAVLALVACLSACYGGSSGPTPGDMVDVLGALSAHGATMTDTVAGDAGCADQSLVDNARRLQLSFSPDGQTYTAYLFRWLNNADYVDAGPAFEQCLLAYRAAHAGTDVMSVEVSPWRAFGPAWTAALRDAINQGLTDAAEGVNDLGGESRERPSVVDQFEVAVKQSENSDVDELPVAVAVMRSPVLKLTGTANEKAARPLEFVLTLVVPRNVPPSP
jgi:hypothetical protein